MYRITYDPESIEQVKALPIEALASYLEVVKVLALTPWNGRPYNRLIPDDTLREWMFGPSGHGVVTYMILEDQRRVDVLLVQWTG